jgi:hypothetical protein
MRKITLLALSLLALTGCGSPDYYEELSGSYLYYGGDGDGILATTPNKKSIYGKVTRLGFDDNFIIAFQKPDYTDYHNHLSDIRRTDVTKYPENSDEDLKATNSIADSLLKNDPFYVKVFSSKANFWIISHRNNRVYGPLNKHEYEALRTELKVPIDLELEDRISE